MARARLASRFETLSAGFARLRQKLSHFIVPLGAACGAASMSRPYLIIQPICAPAPLRGESWLAGDYFCAAACCAASAICALT